MNKKIPLLIISSVLFITCLLVLEKLLMPKYSSGIVEGALIESYYKEDLNHDILFIGDCEVYENFSPITLWEDFGYTSYIRGSAQQLIWQSYYLLEESLRYEKPDIVIFNVLSMKYDQPQKEAYNRMTLDGMKLSRSKIESIKASMLDDEYMIEYLLPLLRYHSRWSELNQDDFTYLLEKKKMFHNGYYMRVDTKPVDYLPRKKKLANYEFGDNSYKYLNMMTQLCKENNIELILIKAPTLYPVWYDEWDMQMAEYADKHELLYINFLEHIEASKIDFSTDTYDGGLHLNLSGAEKLSRYFGSILKEHYHLEDKRSNPTYMDAWQRKSDFYYAMRDKQYVELETFGKIKMYGEVKK